MHGFNTSFDEARFRLAQIAVDGGFNGVPVLFTWPSRGSLFAYGSDRESAMASRDALEHVLRRWPREPDVGKVHVLAHSMGAWLAMEALREIAIAGHPDLDGHLGDIMLAAPDIDLDVFRQQMARLGSFAHVSIFAASNDRALALSGMLADRPRLGALDPSNPADRQAIKELGVAGGRPQPRQRRLHRPRHLCGGARRSSAASGPRSAPPGPRTATPRPCSTGRRRWCRTGCPIRMRRSSAAPLPAVVRAASHGRDY